MLAMGRLTFRRGEPQVHGELFGNASPQRALRKRPTRTLAALHSHAQAQAQSTQQAPRTQKHTIARVHKHEMHDEPRSRPWQWATFSSCGAS